MANFLFKDITSHLTIANYEVNFSSFNEVNFSSLFFLCLVKIRQICYDVNLISVIYLTVEIVVQLQKHSSGLNPSCSGGACCHTALQ